MTEILTFNVTDSSRNVVPDQVLTVVIQPDDNQPPVVEVLSGIEVSSGGYVSGQTELAWADPEGGMGVWTPLELPDY